MGSTAACVSSSGVVPMETKVQKAIKCVSVFLYGKLSIFSVLLVKTSFVELCLSRKSVPLKHAVLIA